MNKEKMKISILPNYFLNEDGTFNKQEAILLSGKIAGVCYDKEGFNHLINEDEEKTKRRVDMTLNNGHHSVYDHIMINFNIENIPKILAMILNNEKEYTTSEKSARYTPVESSSSISNVEIELYNKWTDIFINEINKRYKDVLTANKIKKLAQENARYLITVFMPTQMIYTTSLRQINYIASWLKKYVDNAQEKNDFENKLKKYIYEFISELKRINVLEDGLLKNEKNRSISLFNNNLDKKEKYFGEVYFTTYKGTFAELAQAQRHRTLDYQMQIMTNKEFYVPLIIKDNDDLVNMWNNDMKKVSKYYPQGELILISECGKYDDFILKCMERLCTHAQLEIMLQTKLTLDEYREYLKDSNKELYKDICKYSKGARCTFPNYKCTEKCYFKEGVLLTRDI